jgi:large exoprotein involved in heme utilization and adhesion
LTINPSALLFNQIQAASIQNNSIAPSSLNSSSEITARGFLSVPDGKSLLLVGGDINMDGGALFARGGRVELGGLRGAGTVGLNENSNNLSLTFPTSVERSDVFLNNSAVVYVAAGDGGSIAVNARDLEMTGETTLFAGIESGLGSNNSKAGNIDVNATGVINLNNSSFITNAVLVEASGQAGDININANTLLVKDGAQVGSGIFGAGKGGDLNVDAQDVQLIGTSADGRIGSGLFAFAEKNSTGDAGDLTIKTNTLLIKDGAQINASTFGAGKGGDLNVDAQDVQLIGTSADGQFGSNLAASAEKNSTGDAGDLTIKTNTLLVKDGAVVSAGTFGAGKGADLSVDAQDVQLIGTSADGRIGSGLFANANRNSTGDAGNLTIKTNTLLIKDAAQVFTGTFGVGKGGNLSVDAQDVQIIGPSADSQYSSLLSAAAQRNSTGDAGNLTIKTNTLLIKDGAQVSVSTFDVGKGGNLSVDAQDVRIIGTTADGLYSSLLSASAQPNSTGDAGNLTIKTNTLLIKDGAQVFTGTWGGGKGGNLTVDAQDVQVIGTSADGGISGLVTSTAPGPTGNAGDLTIKTNTLLVQDRAAITVQSLGTGTAGSLIVDANSIYLNNAAEITADTTGGGGDIFLRSPLLLLRNQSSITTNARGSGIPGGNIKIDALNGFIIAVPNENSDISANSVDFRGGKVEISAQGIFGIQRRNTPTPESDITATGASPEFSGSVELNTPDVDPNSGLVELPTVAVDTQIAQGCYSPGYAQNSFIITGRGGLPPNPREAFSSNIVRPEWATLGPSNDINSQQTIKENPPIPTPPAPIVEATGWGTNAKGEIVLTANASTGTPHKSWQQSPVTCSSAKSADN